MPRILTLAALALAASAAPAAACSIAAPIPGSQAPGDVVVAGTVTRIQGNPMAVRPLRVTLRVDTVLRGRAGDTLVVRTNGSSAACGWEFAKGGRYLVFATKGTSDGGLYPKGQLGTSLADANRRLGREETVTGDDLYWPAPEGFDPRSAMTPRQFVEFRAFRLYWTGLGSTGQLQAIRRAPLGGVTAVYANPSGKGTGIHITTRRVCPAGPAQDPAPLTHRRTVRGVPAGDRFGGLSVFTGDVEVRITGGSPATRLNVARSMYVNTRTVSWARTGALQAPASTPVTSLVPC